MFLLMLVLVLRVEVLVRDDEADPKGLRDGATVRELALSRTLEIEEWSAEVGRAVRFVEVAEMLEDLLASALRFDGKGNMGFDLSNRGSCTVDSARSVSSV